MNVYQYSSLWKNRQDRNTVINKVRCSDGKCKTRGGFKALGPHFLLVYCERKKSSTAVFNMHQNVLNSKGLHPYFIKNPLCICYSSLDHHLYPLWVIFIRVTVVTLKLNQSKKIHFKKALLFKRSHIIQNDFTIVFEQ